MARTLNVYLNPDLVGQLIQDDSGQMLFQYADSWLDNPDAIPLSHSLPKRKEIFRQKECRGFFGGTLPEESKRQVIARILGISAGNDFAMLEQIGGECAGAVTFLPESEPLPADAGRYRQLDEMELARILHELPRRPLMAGEDGIRLSLAGVQDKIAVRLDSSRISIPLDSAPSSHILKPAIAICEGIVFNEAFCLALARGAGLDVANATIAHAEDIDYLLVERFDRHRDADGNIVRLHQEDFCQALGIPSEIKYQSEGGPSLAACFALLRETSSAPVVDLRALLDAVIFNLIIGNHDAHAKNFSLLYLPDGSTRLAPLYDLVCTVFYPELTDRMAMKVGKEARSGMVFPQHIDRFARDAGLAVPATVARVSSMASAILELLPGIEKPHQISEKLAELIAQRCKTAIRRFRAK